MRFVGRIVVRHVDDFFADDDEVIPSAERAAGRVFGRFLAGVDDERRNPRTVAGPGAGGLLREPVKARSDSHGVPFRR